jgi:solute carrier family 25 uncoupling protein 27
LKRNDDTFSHKAAKGLFAGGFSQLIASPADLIKVQIQNDPTKRVMSVIRKLYSEFGLFGFFRGWQPNVLRACLVNVGELTTYDYTKSSLIKTIGLADTTFTHFLSSCVSGCIATFVSTPADVVKSNYMSNPKLYQNSLIYCVKSILNERGFLFFWKGFMLNWIRLGPWQVLLLLHITYYYICLLLLLLLLSLLLFYFFLLLPILLLVLLLLHYIIYCIN